MMFTEIVKQTLGRNQRTATKRNIILYTRMILSSSAPRKCKQIYRMAIISVSRRGGFLFHR